MAAPMRNCAHSKQIAGSALSIKQEAYVSLRIVVIGICNSYCVVCRCVFSGNEIREFSELYFVLTNNT